MTLEQVIERETGEPVTEHMLIDELNVDSLEYLELLQVLERQTGVAPTDAQLASLQTVGGLVRAYS